MRITAGQSIWGEDDDGLKFAQARLIPQAVQGWAIEMTSPDPVIQKDGFRTQRLRLRGHVRLEGCQLACDRLHLLLWARRDPGRECDLHALSPPVLMT